MSNPLILPRVGSAGLVVLIGGGEFSFGETSEVDRYLLDHIPAPKRIAFIPAASGSTDYAGHLAAHMRRIDESVELVNVPIYRPRDARREKNLEQLRNASMIYIGGGVTNLLWAAFAKSPVLEALTACLDRGGIVAGIGAGAAVLGSAMRDDETGGRSLPGVGLLPRVAVEAGFDPAADGMLRRLVSLPEISIGVGIARSLGLAIARDGSSEMLGSGSLAVVRKPAP